MECPKCGRSFPRLLALSRTDNKTMVCDGCGVMEAMEAFNGFIHKRQAGMPAGRKLRKG